MNGDLTGAAPGPPVTVALACNEAYFQGLYCTVVSLLLHLPPARRVVFHVLDGGVSGASRDLLERAAGAIRPETAIHWTAVDEGLFSEAELGPSNSRMPYARILLPEILQAPKCLYLDCDILVFRDVSELFDVQLENDAVLAAVPDSETLTLGHDAPAVARAFSLPLDALYYNSGVLLMDLAQLRREKFPGTALRFLSEWKGKYRFHDQSALNFCCARRIATLPGHWNRPSWVFDTQADNNLECLLHFTNFVPWRGGRPGPAQAVFEKFAAEAGLPVNRWSRDFRKTRLKWLLRNAVSPARALGFPAAAALCRLAGEEKKASEYLKAGHYWQKHILGSVSRVKRHRERGRLIEATRFVAERIPTAG